MINRTNLIDIIGKTPGLRTVQICDMLDCDMEELMAALELVSSANGPVVGYNTQAPNGRPATAWRLAGIAAPSVAPSLSPPVSKDPAWLSTKIPLTNVEKAIAFIKGNGGSATGSELHKLLGLQPTHYPSTYLGSGLKDGRLIKTGAKWTLGESTPPPKEEQKIPEIIPAPKVPVFLHKVDPQPPSFNNPKQMEKHCAPAAFTQKDVDEAIKPIIEKVPDLALSTAEQIDAEIRAEIRQNKNECISAPASLPETPTCAKSQTELSTTQWTNDFNPPSTGMDPTGAFPAEISDAQISALHEQWEADMLALDAAAKIDPAPEFLCALCSNGELRLERRGEAALILSKDELTNLRAYLACVNMYDLVRLKF